MTTLNLALPKAMRGFVEDQAEAGGFSTACEYVLALIREDQKRAAMQSLERELLKGLESGPPIEVTAEYWSNMKAELKQRHAQSKRSGRKSISRR